MSSSNNSCFWRAAGIAVCLAALWLGSVKADPLTTQLGDLDNDGVATVRDLVLLRGHMNQTQPLNAAQAVLADLTNDGFVNSSDVDEIVKVILQSRAPEQLPLASVRQSSPANGEGEVALTRETIVHFSMPLAPSATLDTHHFYAQFGGRKILSRVDISSDRKKATLFYLEPLLSNARITVTLDGAGLTDLLGRAVDLDGDGVAGGVYRQTFDTLSITPLPGTAISGRVFASERAAGGADIPLAGVTITVDGAEETLRTTTDGQGNFTLTPCPAGTFFVHIDGRTSPQSSYPNGNYYPSVGKRWEAIAGRTANLSGNSQDTSRGTVYLPCICGGTLNTVSQTQDSPIDFPAEVLDANPALQGTQLLVPANSLFADDGTRGGKVGMAPVVPDRLPSPLPPGLDLPMVITIQTDGATNFDRPVPVCFPNLPDPATGEKLPPGAKSALWSFNHDTGEWEVVGPMTVTADGNFVKTDVGVGVRQPGWHGQMPGTQIEGPEEEDDTCSGADVNWLAFGFNAVGTAASCAKDFVGKDYKAVKSLLKAAAKAKKLYDLAKKISNDLANGRLDCATRRALIYQFKEGIRELEKALTGSAELGNPLAKVVSAVKCLEDTMKLFEPFCEGVDEQPECFSWLGRKTCGIRAGLEEKAKRFRQMADIVAKAASNLALGPLQYAVTQAELHIEEDCNPSPSGVPVPAAAAASTPTNDLQQAMILDFLNIAGALEGFDEIPATDGDQLLDAILRDSADALGAIGKLYVEQEGAMPGAYVRVDYDNIVQRLRANASGRIKLILPPDTPFTLTFLDSSGQKLGFWTGLSPTDGGRLSIPGVVLQPDDSPDADGDGLGIHAESVVGTEPNNPDSDGDGILDGAEVLEGTNPLGNLIAQTGIVASTPTQSAAIDIAAFNNLAAVATGADGVTIFNVLSGLNPVRVATIDTDGNAQAVAISSNYVAVADGNAGIAVVDVSRPGNPVFSRQISTGGDARCIATDGLIAYVGLATGQIVVADLASGAILQRYSTGAGAIDDLVLGHEFLYVLKPGTLSTHRLTGAVIVPSATIASPGSRSASGRRLRLFAGDTFLWAFNAQGYNVFSLSNPAAPTLLDTVTTQQFGWKMMVANGSGLGVAAVGANGTNSGAHDVSLYDVGQSGRTTAFQTTLATPGLAYALTIYNGLAYVADGSAGMEVINYLPYDSQGVKPGISLDASFPLNHTSHTGVAEEGKLMRLTAAATDDVQVRNVEFYLNDALQVVDGNFPFEHRFVTPSRASSGATFTVRAKVMDTGGNVTWSEAYTITLVADATPPTVTTASPAAGALVGRITNLQAFFSEPMKVDSLNLGSFLLTGAGPDRVFGTADDFTPSAALSYRENLRAAFLVFSEVGLTPGNYRLQIQAPAADAAGNQIASPFVSSFQVYDTGLDSDGDGIPDDLEAMLGLNPNKADSDNDGIPDGQEDRDSDGVTNAAELFLGLNPLIADSDGDGILDRDEDEDLDGLRSQGEFLAGTDIYNPDTDGDGWTDEAEVTGNGDPLDPAIGPRLFVSTANQAPVRVIVLQSEQANAGYGAITNRPQADTGVFIMRLDFSSATFGMITNQPQADTGVFIMKLDSSNTSFGMITNQPQAATSVRINP